MAKKPWGGRFKIEVDDLMRDFSQSVSFDARLAEVDIMGSIAHARMLGARGIIGDDEARRLVGALEELLEDARSDKLSLDKDLEDVHMNVESLLGDKVGDLSGKLHTGRSRNDQVALDMRLYFRERVDETRELVLALCRALVGKAEEYQDAIMPGFTHTRKAQPILFSHHLLAYVEMLLRDAQRLSELRRRINVCPLGAGALSGTTFPIDREMVAKELGFDGVTENSVDAVSDRDWMIELAADASIVMVHLSRLMEELIWWGLPEIGFIELDESFCTGSSMMPNKKNPDAAELVRGKTGRVIGALTSLLVTMKGVPLSYNRDFQEDKEGTFDLADTLIQCLMVAERLVSTMEARPERMREAAKTGFVLATDVADYLAGKGMPFREAHEVVGKMVRSCEESGRGLEDLSLEELQGFSDLFGADVSDWISLDAAVTRRDVIGGTAPPRVAARIEALKKELGGKR